MLDCSHVRFIHLTTLVRNVLKVALLGHSLSIHQKPSIHVFSDECRIWGSEEMDLHKRNYLERKVKREDRNPGFVIFDADQ